MPVNTDKRKLFGEPGLRNFSQISGYALQLEQRYKDVSELLTKTRALNIV